MGLPTARDVAKIQQFLKASWEASQNWLWLALMWLSIAVNFSHIEDILSRWSGVSDWTTWGGAVVVEIISGLSWSNALTHLGTILASTGRSATKEKKRRARVYFGLSLVAGLIAVCFSAFANILWFNWHYTAGLVAPVATVICAVMEASRRYEIRIVAAKKQEKAEEEQRVVVGRQKEAEERHRMAQQRHLLGTLGPEMRTLMALKGTPMATQGQLAGTIGKSRGTVRKDLQKLVKVGAIAKNGDGWEVLWNF